LGVERTASLPLSTASHVQPEPKRLTPASLSCVLSSSRPPNVSLIAAASAPEGSPPPLGAHDLPEQRVVCVAAAVVADRGALVLGDRIEAPEYLDRAVGPVCALECRAEVRHVGLVVLIVVDLHRLRVDRRFERVECVGQRGKRESHRLSFWSLSV
jgi:hypothetical protein